MLAEFGVDGAVSEAAAEKSASSQQEAATAKAAKKARQREAAAAAAAVAAAGGSSGTEGDGAASPVSGGESVGQENQEPQDAAQDQQEVNI